MSKINKHGLPRRVPAGIAREVRRRCGFGCVKCGSAIYDLEHFEPDYKDAVEHNADGITLLCMQCNQKKARGLLSAATVKRCNQKPRCKEDGFASEFFDFGLEGYEVVFGGARFKNCADLVRVSGTSVLSIAPPTEKGMPFLLSGKFFGVDGKSNLIIEDNQFQVLSGNWDVEIEGGVITVRSEPRNIVLRLRTSPPDTIVVERLKMRYGSYSIEVDESSFRFTQNGGLWIVIKNAFVDGAPVGFELA